MEALAIAVAMREARHLGQIGRAGDAGPRAGAAGDGGARPLESRLRRFRRRRADGNLRREFSRGWRRRRWRRGLEPPTLLALLKHPLCRLGRAQGAFKARIETLELALLRGTRPQAGSGGLAREFARFREELGKLRQRRDLRRCIASEPRARLDADALDQAPRR